MKPKRNGSRIAIDYEKVRVLAFLNPSNDELAWGLGISRATLYKRNTAQPHLSAINETYHWAVTPRR